MVWRDVEKPGNNEMLGESLKLLAAFPQFDLLAEENRAKQHKDRGYVNLTHTPDFLTFGVNPNCQITSREGSVSFKPAKIESNMKSYILVDPSEIGP